MDGDGFARDCVLCNSGRRIKQGLRTTSIEPLLISVQIHFALFSGGFRYLQEIGTKQPEVSNQNSFRLEVSNDIRPVALFFSFPQTEERKDFTANIFLSYAPIINQDYSSMIAFFCRPL